MPTYSQSQREYWFKRPADVLKFMAVQFYHPDFNYIRLVANQYSDKIFEGDSYQAVAMKVPEVTNQTTDTTKAGTIVFGRIGVNVRQALLSITPIGSLTPIEVTLKQYEDGITLPVYERRLYVDKNGISISADAVNVRLSVNNPAKLTQEDQFYDPSVFKGLQFV